MADDVKDIYVSTDAGTEWQSLSALAAEQVGDPKLPIESVDGTVKLSDSAASFVVSTGGTERLKVKPASYGSAAVTIGEDHLHSIGGISIKNDPTQVNYTAQMQMRFVDENGKYAYVGCSEPRFALGGGNALVDGGVLFVGHDSGNSVLFSGSGDVIIAIGGLANASERVRITDDAAIFKNQIRTPSVRGLVDSDAQVTLGGQATLKAGDGSAYVPTDDASLLTKGSLSGENGLVALPVSSTDGTVTLQSPAADEFEVELAGEMKLRITENDIQASPGYQPQSDTSLVTKRFLYGQGGGSTPIVPPGQNSGAIWQTRVVDQSGYANSQVRLQNNVLACDGIFTIGPAWSANGVDWFDSGSGSGSWEEKELSWDNGHFIVKGDIGMYMSGSGAAFSYNMQNWVSIGNAGPEIGNAGAWTDKSPVIYWNNDFFLSKLDTSGSNADDDSGRIPSTRSNPRADQGPWIAFSRFDYSTARWSVTRKEAEIWFAGQTSKLDKLGKDDLPDIRYTCSKPDGTMVLGVQEPFSYNVSSPDTAQRLCYIKTNANQDVDSVDNAYQASWEVIPQFSNFDAGDIQGIAYDQSNDRWVFITAQLAYSCQGNPSNATWRSQPLPLTANWSDGFHHNGIEFIATASATNANVGIYSADGLGWQATYDIETNSEYTACGTNGRSILSGIDTSLAATFTYAITPVHVTSGTTTADVNLNEPVDTSAAYAERTGRATLLTQEDANGYFDEEIKQRAIVVTLKQAEYDAIPSGQLESNTLYCITD